MKAAIRKTFKAIGRVLARRSVRHVTVICLLFGLMVGGGAYMAHHSASLFASKPPEPVRSGTGSVTGSGSMKDDDPVKNFARTGVGHVLFSGAGSDNCKRTLFDNRTGSYKEVDDISCVNGGDQAVDDKKSEQLNSMRKAFSGSSKK
ncbi:MAG: hypothetical protein K2Z80_01710 [Xanthobacteraceae bacterium]|nr:hypothetical protein [Xanthobacteraceae bacterium]